MLAGTVDGIVVLRSDFSRRLFSAGGAPCQVIVDGTDANTARIISGYVDGAWQTWLAHYAMDHGLAVSAPLARSTGSGSIPRSAAATSSCPASSPSS